MNNPLRCKSFDNFIHPERSLRAACGGLFKTMGLWAYHFRYGRGARNLDEHLSRFFVNKRMMVILRLVKSAP